MQALTDIRNFQVTYFLKEGKNDVIFETHRFFIAGMKAQRGEGTGRVLMGDNTGGGCFGLLLIRLQNGGVWTSFVLPRIYRYGPPYVNSIPTRANSKLNRTFVNVNYCASRGVSVLENGASNPQYSINFT
jgi:hypothetical protein